MPRPIVLGNGKLTVTLDEDLSIRDLYYPYVGLYNHVGGYRCRIGVWTADHGFSWIDDGWNRTFKTDKGSSLIHSTLTNRSLAIALHFEQTVHPVSPFFLQRITVQNLIDDPRAVRLFIAYDLRIAESDIGDTAFYNPYVKAMIHYKRDHYFLISGYVGDDRLTADNGIAAYACGIKEFGGAEGSWRDAEDGELSGNAIAQGSVDSVIGFNVPLTPHGSSTLRAWLVAATDLPKVSELQQQLLEKGFDAYFEDAASNVTAVGGHLSNLIDKLPDEISRLFYRSLTVVKTHLDPHGGIIASLDSDIMQTARAHYAYTWPRDGALTAHALDRAGLTTSTEPFFAFCVQALSESLAQGYWKSGAALMHKYSPDGTIGSSWHPWVVPGGAPEPPIQEDGTALVVWAAVQHSEFINDDKLKAVLYKQLIRPAADFLVGYRDTVSGLPLPSWDVWEERRGIHIFTVSAVIGGLTAAGRLASAFDDKKSARVYQSTAETVRTALLAQFWDQEAHRFARMLTLGSDGVYTKDMTVDSSAYALFAFGALEPDHPKVAATMEAIGRALWVKTRVGGLARYEKDYYFRVSDEFDKVNGNPWIICTLWLAEWAIGNSKTVDDLGSALDLLRWVTLCALPTGVLPEQVHPHTGAPLSVAPLTWSHAQFITTTLKYVERLEQLTGV